MLKCESVTASETLVTTKFLKTPVGSLLIYQTSFTESKFVDLYSILRNNVHSEKQCKCHNRSVHYPRFPLNETDMVMLQQLDDAECALLNFLTVDENYIKSNTRDQVVSGQCTKECTYRFIYQCLK